MGVLATANGALGVPANVQTVGATDAGAELGGFAGAAGNVLVDGKRPTIKSGGLEDFLSRIPADAVDRIEVTRGAQRAGETAGQGLNPRLW